MTLGPLIADDDPVPGTGRLTAMRVTLSGLVRAHLQQGDENISFLELSAGDPAQEGYGCDQHPSAATHARLAVVLAHALSDVVQSPPPGTSVVLQSIP